MDLRDKSLPTETHSRLHFTDVAVFVRSRRRARSVANAPGLVINSLWERTRRIKQGSATIGIRAGFRCPWYIQNHQRVWYHGDIELNGGDDGRWEGGTRGVRVQLGIRLGVPIITGTLVCTENMRFNLGSIVH